MEWQERDSITFHSAVLCCKPWVTAAASGGQQIRSALVKDHITPHEATRIQLCYLKPGEHTRRMGYPTQKLELPAALGRASCSTKSQFIRSFSTPAFRIMNKRQWQISMGRSTVSYPQHQFGWKYPKSSAEYQDPQKSLPWCPFHFDSVNSKDLLRSCWEWGMNREPSSKELHHTKE